MSFQNNIKTDLIGLTKPFITKMKSAHLVAIPTGPQMPYQESGNTLIDFWKSRALGFKGSVIPVCEGLMEGKNSFEIKVAGYCAAFHTVSLLALCPDP